MSRRPSRGCLTGTAVSTSCASTPVSIPRRRSIQSPRKTGIHVLAVNLRGNFLCVQKALPLLRASSQPRIVLTSSITGPVTGIAGLAHYGASKAAQLGFMRSIAVELATSRITVNAVLPGTILTESLAQLGEDFVEAARASVPLGRLGTVEDIAHAVLFLASAEAGFITGQTLIVDGGQVLPESK